MKNIFKLKYIALLLCFVLLLPTALSCKARPLTENKQASTEVGTVGKYSVLYEELYFLAKNYSDAVKSKYGDDTEALRAATLEYVNQNITSNYAILALCEKNGITYDEKELAEEIEQSIELIIDSDFGGSRSDYLAAQKEAGLTDHYVRFTTGVDILYERLALKYRTDGMLPNSDKAITEHINQSFIHTWHIAVFINEGDDRAAKLAKAEEALAALNNGTSMFELIGSKYNEDLIPSSLKDTDGYYFPRGIMDKAYEAAAFELNVDQHSGIISGMGENNNGQYVECLYIIERLPMKEEEIEKNFVTLSDMMAEAIISSDMEDIRADMSFSLNSYGASLDLLNMKAAKNGIDYQLWITVSVCVLLVASIVAAVIIVRHIKTKRFQQQYRLNKK